MAIPLALQHYKVRQNYVTPSRDTKAQRHNTLTISMKPALAASTTYHGIQDLASKNSLNVNRIE